MGPKRRPLSFEHSPMRPFRRPPNPERPGAGDGAVVHGALPLTPEEPALFAGESGPVPSGDAGTVVPVDLVAGPAGMTVGPSSTPSDGSPGPVPSLILWSSVVGASVTHPALLPDGTVGRVVEIELERGGGAQGASRAAVRAAHPRCRALPRRLSAAGTPRPTESVHPGSAGGRAGRQRRRGVGRSHRMGVVDPPCRRASATVVGRNGSDRSSWASWPWCCWPAAVGPSSRPRRRVRPHGQPTPIHALERGQRRAGLRAHPAVSLPAATSTPAPAPPSLAGAAPLQSHEIFGYAPYWTLPQSAGFDVQDLTTLAYFSVDANADGTLDQSGAGLERLREPGPGEPGQPVPCRRGPGGPHRDLLQPELAQRHHLGPERSGPAVGGPDRRGLGQEPRRGQLRLRGGGECRPQSG